MAEHLGLVKPQEATGAVLFALVDRQLRIFRHGLLALSKIGAELMLEALPARVGGAKGAAGKPL